MGGGHSGEVAAQMWYFQGYLEPGLLETTEEQGARSDQIDG